MPGRWCHTFVVAKEQRTNRGKAVEELVHIEGKVAEAAEAAADAAYTR